MPELDKLDDMAETLNDLTIKNTAYHVSDSANADDANGNPASDPKTVTHASDGKKKLADASNGILQKTLLSNQTLTIVTMIMDPRMDDMIATCRGNPHTLAIILQRKSSRMGRAAVCGLTGLLGI